jgi:predicted deacetylase
VIPKPAQYLLRFDDLCPTISSERWGKFRQLIEEFNVHPILAVVPDNRDSDLERSPYDPNFWPELRKMEAAGAVIAVHGYQHLCHGRGSSLLGIHRQSEFAGVNLETQREWIHEGLRILREKGLKPRLWIAPRHGFDRNTLRALSDAGLDCISDGFARIPHRRHGVTWIPQQLWSPVVKSEGLWTICIHPYAARSSEIDGLRRFLQYHGGECTSFDRVLKDFRPKPLGLSERLYERIALWRVQRRHRLRRQHRHIGKSRRSSS